VVGYAPVARHEAALLEPHQRRIERAHVELQRAAGDLLDPLGNRVAVQRAERRQRLQHHEVERALENARLALSSIGHANRVGLLRWDVKWWNEIALRAHPRLPLPARDRGERHEAQAAQDRQAGIAGVDGEIAIAAGPGCLHARTDERAIDPAPAM